ncbi:hypothetical protein ACFRCW_41705 [Streptomyces sp. NPDC056653]|uniref:hypothetical protein n=1 Tax=Streptomyces sp. NPDC056653 TaxID=3345894 RepID=UPI0036C831F3
MSRTASAGAFDRDCIGVRKPVSPAASPCIVRLKDCRRAELTISTFGAVHGVAEGAASPVCDTTAGYAPFGLGHRRCAGEQLTTEFTKDFLHTVWRDGIESLTLDIEHPEKLPVSPRAVIDGNIAFQPGN